MVVAAGTGNLVVPAPKSPPLRCGSVRGLGVRGLGVGGRNGPPRRSWSRAAPSPADYPARAEPLDGGTMIRPSKPCGDLLKAGQQGDFIPQLTYSDTRSPTSQGNRTAKRFPQPSTSSTIPKVVQASLASQGIIANSPCRGGPVWVFLRDLRLPKSVQRRIQSAPAVRTAELRGILVCETDPNEKGPGWASCEAISADAIATARAC